MNNPSDIVEMFLEKLALQTEQAHQVSLYMLRLHPLLQVVDGMKCFILHKHQFRHNCLKSRLVKKKKNKRDKNHHLDPYVSALSFKYEVVTQQTDISFPPPHLVKVPSKSIHKVTLMFLQHPHHSLQLGLSEALLEGTSSLKGSSGPFQQMHTLHRVRLQAWLPQPGPRTAAKSLLLTPQVKFNTFSVWLITVPSTS